MQVGDGSQGGQHVVGSYSGRHLPDDHVQYGTTCLLGRRRAGHGRARVDVPEAVLGALGDGHDVAGEERLDGRLRARPRSTPGSSTRQTEASIRSASEPVPSPASTHSRTATSVGQRGVQRGPHGLGVAALGDSPISRYSASLAAPVGRGAEVGDLRVRAEAGRERHRHLGPAQRPLERAGEVAVARRTAAGRAWRSGCAASGRSAAAAARRAGGPSDDGEREQAAAGRADLDLGAHRRADAAVVARGPAAVVDLLLGQRVLPVVPEPLLVQPGVQVVPGQHLVLGALAGGEPVEVDAEGRQLLGGRRRPAVEGEVLAPAVELAAVAPDPLDDPADPAVAAGEQSLDHAGLAVVVAQADGAADAAVLVDRLRAAAAAGGRSSRRWPGRPTGTGCAAWARTRRCDTVQRMSLRAAGLAAGPDHLDGQLGDLQHVLVGLGRQTAHEVELHLAPAVGVGGRHRADQVLLGHRLVDHPADPLAAALGGEGQAGAPSVAGQLVGQGDVEGVDPGATAG